MRTLKWIFIDESIVNKPDFYMKCPVKLIKIEFNDEWWVMSDEWWVNCQQAWFLLKCPVKLIKIEKVGQTIINEFCVKFFVRRGSTTKYENISVTSSTASLSLHASKKDNWRFSVSFFFFYLEVTFNSMILNLIKISRVLNLVCDSGETIFYGVLFSRFQKANMKKGH